MNEPLRFGIMGTGNIAHQFAEGLAGSERCVLSAVGSRSVEAADRFASRFGDVPGRHGSYDALIADDGVDAIYVSLPNSMHREWTIKSLEAGKHVLCEKPMAVSAAEVEEMFDVAERAGRVLVEAFMYKSHPLTKQYTKHIAEGAIGRVRSVRGSFCYRTKKIDGNVRFSEPLAGGALMDIGCYCVHFARMIAGQEPDWVEATGRLHETGVDVAAAGAMRFPNGVLATFTCAMDTQMNNAAYIGGEEGYIEVPVPWKPPVKDARAVIDSMTPPRQDGGGVARDKSVLRVDAPKPLYGLEADDFAAAVFDGTDPVITRHDSLGNMRVLDAMRRQVGLSF